jgi:sugar phosphate isomerase/epimerase
VFCLEPLAPTVTNFLNTSAETVEFVRSLRSPAARVVLDVFAMSSDALAPADIIRRTGADLGYFHANDTNGRGPGQGAADYEAIARALAGIGYDEWASVEVFDFTPGADAIARESLAFLRAVFHDRSRGR